MIFISGETTGDYKEKFKEAEKMLKSKGYRVVNMANVRGMYDTWEEYMKASITNIPYCDEVLKNVKEFKKWLIRMNKENE